MDGHLSIQYYLDAIEKCYRLLQRKLSSRYGRTLTTDKMDYICFHSPFAKMVYKSFKRMVLLDDANMSEADVESNFARKVEPSMKAARQLGNIYTGSVYGGLASLLESGEL